jgi:hypothetical protein
VCSIVHVISLGTLSFVKIPRKIQTTKVDDIALKYIS